MITKNRKGKLSFLKYNLGVFIAMIIILIFTTESKSYNSTVIEALNEHDLSRSEAVTQQKSAILEKDSVYIDVEVPASFKGGDLQSFRKWIQSHMDYPDVASRKGIQGKIYVQFVVNLEGEVVDVKIMRGLDPLLDNEALRVIKSSPKWKPAMIGGKIVKQQFTIPLSFVLQ